MNANVTIKPTQVVVAGKSVGVALLLTIFFGPVGLFYASIRGALILIFGVPTVAVILGGLGMAAGHNNQAMGLGAFGLIVLVLALSYPVSIIWAVTATNAYNKKLLSQAIS